MTSAEQRAADRRYNDALTALDRAVVAVSAQPIVAREDVDRVATALIVFLQQITAFVDTRNRDVAADAGARIDALERSLAPIAELRAQMNIVQRAVQALSRAGTQAPAAAPDGAAPTAAAGGAAPSSDHQYVAFEDQFRGTDAAIAAKLRSYVPVFTASAMSGPVVDLGCGRGELLAALGAAGVRAIGVDANGEMAAIARSRGLEAAEGDALTFLEAAADESLGGVVATQVVEHLEPAYLMRLLATASRKLQPQAPIVLETINAACWLAFFSSYIRDLTHVRPVHPETLQYLVRANGFERVEIRYRAPVSAEVKMKTIDLDPAMRAATDPTAVALAAIAHTVNVNAVILNSLMFTHLDFAVIGYRL